MLIRQAFAKLPSVLFCVILLSIAPFHQADAQSANAETDPVSEPNQFNNGHDLMVFGDRIDQTIDKSGDILVIGQHLQLSGASGRNQFAGGLEVVLDGDSKRDVFVAGLDINLHSQVGGRIFAAGQNINIAETASSQDGIMAVGQYLLVDGQHGGDVYLLGEKIYIAGQITGDVFIKGDELSFTDNARIDGKLIYRTLQAAEIPASVISPERVDFRLLPPKDKPSLFDHFLSYASLPISLAILGLLLAWLTPGFWHNSSERCRQELGPCFLTGAGAFFILILFPCLLFITFVGITTAVLLVLALPLFLFTGVVISLNGLGLRLFKPISHRGKFIAFGGMLTILFLSRFVPLADTALMAVICLPGMGAIIRSLHPPGDDIIQPNKPHSSGFPSENIR